MVLFCDYGLSWYWWGFSSAGRASGSQSEGHGFKSRKLHHQVKESRFLIADNRVFYFLHYQVFKKDQKQVWSVICDPIKQIFYLRFLLKIKLQSLHLQVLTILCILSSYSVLTSSILSDSQFIQVIVKGNFGSFSAPPLTFTFCSSMSLILSSIDLYPAITLYGS